MLKVGLIGCGFMGGMHSACYKEIDGVEIVAVADVRPEKAEEIAKVHNATIYTTGEELIENADVDIIDILNSKLDKTEKKYPIEKAKGNSTKYDKF